MQGRKQGKDIIAQDFFTRKSEKMSSAFWKWSRWGQSIGQERAEPQLLERDPRILQATAPFSNRRVNNRMKRLSKLWCEDFSFATGECIKSMSPQTDQCQALNYAQNCDRRYKGRSWSLLWTEYYASQGELALWRVSNYSTWTFLKYLP